MGKMKSYWQDQQDLKHMYDFNLQESLLKRMEKAIEQKQAQKTQESGSQRFTAKPVVQKESTT